MQSQASNEVVDHLNFCLDVLGRLAPEFSQLANEVSC